ncbi:MAG: GNAT family N-acetyltransferase [Pseudomonadota bacterium]
MLIRPAKSADADAILALVPRLASSFTPPPWREPAAMTATDLDVVAEALASSGDDPCVFVAVIENVVAGFVHVRSLEDYYRRRKHGHVADLVVADGHEGKGVATTLLERAEEWSRAQGFDWMTIAVFEQNARAERLYQKLGYGRDVIRLLKPLT